MTWHAYRLVYQVKSPLHVGWRKMGNLMQTRPYITGRTWWGAATSLLTQHMGTYEDYRNIGKRVRDNLVFGYFFLADETRKPFLPAWKEGELCYADLSADQLQQRFLSSMASTAIDHESETAAEGQLHEVEFIAPKDADGRDVFVVGHLFANGDQVTCEPKAIRWEGVDLLTAVLRNVQIGGERRYGFGVLELVTQDGVEKVGDVFGRPFLDTGGIPSVRLQGEDNRALPFHCRVDGLAAEGEIEPLVGREWDAQKGPGHKPVLSAAACWTPGSIAQSDCSVEIGEFGVGRFGTQLS